ncbi:hypothetical protein [Streptomyces aureus]|nr:hypothetical protein [Streptomyces aureus]
MPRLPHGAQLMAADDTTADAYTSTDGHKRMEKSEAYAIWL